MRDDATEPAQYAWDDRLVDNSMLEGISAIIDASGKNWVLFEWAGTERMKRDSLAIPEDFRVTSCRVMHQQKQEED